MQFLSSCISLAIQVVQAAYRRVEGFQSPVGRERTDCEEDIFGLENAQKAIGGFQAGLLDKGLIANKAAREKKLQQFVASGSKNASGSGDPWRKSKQP